ncbi:hypothetical protein K450DRAFT_232020 [Umbelopsis ramanniana AG]|uniref:RanBP2-type domain-containing protein n=1 Tax=Umbelopsis ramanniana AG TaxID=1314678 RepID=A0AAD5HGX4_UMBRA|nr:uncharacterized protein K450DRAFT_232020 [Umbelopsis ramanniana AG]KAI8581583.1 hypothetical protein K450DRAFT_232020 [Umbelopsis ramanniana AG]
MYKYATRWTRILTALSAPNYRHIPSVQLKTSQLITTRLLSKSSGPLRSFRRGDWICPNCKLHNKAVRSVCLECGTLAASSRLVRKGDWLCPSCGCYNFQNRMSCKECEELREDVKESLKASGIDV